MVHRVTVGWCLGGSFGGRMYYPKAIIDGKEISLSTGDWLKIAPAAKRQFFASDISGITYICIQVKENSLEHFTAEDAVIG